MHWIRTRYHGLSFKGRLLLLLVSVAVIQASVAAYTYLQLESKPAEQRVQAQLNAALRGLAPVMDAHIERANERLRTLSQNEQLKPSVEREDWTEVEMIITESDEVLVEDPAEPDAAFTDGSSDASDIDAAAAKAIEIPAAYVTDATGDVVAGTRPDGAVVEQAGVTTIRYTQGPTLLATLHVPVAVDTAFLKDQVLGYIPKGVDVFVADDRRLVSTAGDEKRPASLRSGLHEVNIDGGEQLALIQPLLDGSVLVGATIPADVAAAQRESGKNSLWGFIVLLAVMMIGMAWFITRAVADALRGFADTAQDLAGGNLSRRIPVVGEDEVAQLSSSFNDMAQNLEERIDSLIDARARMRRQVDLFGEALANATSIGEMLQAVCSLAMEASHATHARFWTIGEDGHYAHAACIGLRASDTEPSALEKAVPVRNIPMRTEGVPSWLVVPARKRDGQIVGLLTLVAAESEFSDDDVRLAERIAVQAAVALDNARMHERLRDQATRDGLTGLPNHRSLQDELTKRLEEADRAGMPLGICMLDIDNFKRVNDTYGHPVGDEAIQAIGRTLALGIGNTGMVGRYGGEEFVVIMPGCDSSAAFRIADRLREDIARIEVPLEDGGVLKLTSSFGVANVDQQHAGVRIDNAELLHQADVGLYNAKRTGKNKVELAGPDTVSVEMSATEQAKLAARERGDIAAEQAAAAALETNTPAPRISDDYFSDVA